MIVMAETKKTTAATKPAATKTASTAKAPAKAASATKATAAKTAPKAAAAKSTATKAAAPKAAAKPVGKQLQITLVKSGCGRLKKQMRTLEALGLRKTHSTTIKPDNACTRGMIFVVKHLVEVKEI